MWTVEELIDALRVIPELASVEVRVQPGEDDDIASVSYEYGRALIVVTSEELGETAQEDD